MKNLKLIALFGMLSVALTACSQNPYTPVNTGYATTGVTGVYPGTYAGASTYPGSYPYTNTGIINTMSPVYSPTAGYTTGFYQNPYVMNPYLYFNFNSANTPQAALQAQLMYSLSFRSNPNFYFPSYSNNNCSLRRQPTFTPDSCACYQAPCDCEKVLADYRASHCSGSVRRAANNINNNANNSTCGTANNGNGSGRNTCAPARVSHYPSRKAAKLCNKDTRRGRNYRRKHPEMCEEEAISYVPARSNTRPAPCSTCSVTYNVYTNGTNNNSSCGPGACTNPSTPSRTLTPAKTYDIYGVNGLDANPEKGASAAPEVKPAKINQPGIHPTITCKDAHILYDLLAVQEVGTDSDPYLPVNTFSKQGKAYRCTLAKNPDQTACLTSDPTTKKFPAVDADFRKNDSSYVCDLELFADGHVAEWSSTKAPLPATPNKKVDDFKNYQGPALNVGITSHPDLAAIYIYGASAELINKTMIGKPGEPAAIKMDKDSKIVDNTSTAAVTDAMIKNGKEVTCIQSVAKAASGTTPAVPSITQCYVRLKPETGETVANESVI